MIPLFSQLGLSILQNRVYKDPETARAAPVGNVELVQCKKTGLVYNREFDPDLLCYDADYQNEQALAMPFQEHLQRVLNVIGLNFNKHGAGIEIGCGKGAFLRLLAAAGYRMTGLDPAYQGDDPSIQKRFYDSHYDGPSPDFIVLRHVLEHISDPWVFLEAVARNSGPECLIYVEVPCFDWIVDRGAFFDVFYEHCNYFTESVLAGAFDDVRDSGHLFGGQYLFIVARVRSFREPFHGRCFGPRDMLRLQEQKARVLKHLESGCETFVWGAGAKGVTFANILWSDGVRVDALVDMNPVKQGGYVGLSGLPVMSQEYVTARDEPCNVVIMNSAYETSIREVLREKGANIVVADQ